MKNKFKKIFSKFCAWLCLKKVKCYGKDVFINSWCRFSPHTSIGTDCHFNGVRIYGEGKVVIGNHFHSGHGLVLLTSNHDYDHGTSLPYGKEYIHKDIIIEDNVWIGFNVMILGGITIGEGAVIQAGSVVVGNIPAYAIAGGNPARVFKNRNIEHYNELKKQQSLGCFKEI